MKGWHRLIATLGMCVALAACNDTLSSVSNKVEHPLPTKVVNRMKAYDMSVGSPIMMRIFKEESVLEVWKQQRTGRYEKIAEYEICKWSGELGPKRQEGDYQAPEGFYTVARHQMNPNSSYYLSFNLGYPNRFDRAHGRTGSNLMVHGACSSAGCYSMTDESVLEIYAFAREAFRGGQEAFQVQAFPFRMTAENMARHRNNPNYDFWRMLKVGYDHFELTRMPPKVDVCERNYVFNRILLNEGDEFVADKVCPPSEWPQALETAYNAYQGDYREAFAEAVRKQNDAGALSLAALLPGNGAAEAHAPMSRPVATAMPAAPAIISDPASAAARVNDEAPRTPDTPAGQPALAAAPLQQSGPVPAAQGAASADTPAASAAMPVPQPQPAPVATPEGASLYAPASPVRAATAQDERPFWKLWATN